MAAVSDEVGVDARDALESGRISRVPLHDAIVNRLRDMIIEGELKPGTRIHESQVGMQLGVSRTPLREAIKFLASEGLVELVPSRGAIVRMFDKKDVADMWIVLRSLERLAGQQACEKGTDRGIENIRRLHDEMLVHYQARRRLEYYKLNQDIHTAIVKLADNETLAYMHGTLQSRLKRIRFIGHEGPNNWADAVKEHEEMIVALEARDAAALVEILDRHLLNGWERVQGMI